MRIASIDIGTNTFLLLVSEFDSSGNLTVLRHEQRIPRIGKDVDKEGNIRKEAFKKSADILVEYRDISAKYNVDHIVATGTSAMRDAKNGADFISHIKSISGIEIEIIPGEEEAKWSYRGALSNFKVEDGKYSVIDIGGGSTEIITGEKNNILSRRSLNIGSVRLTERFFHHDPRIDDEINDFRIFVKDIFNKIIDEHLKNTKLIGVAGTVTTLAAIHQNLEYIDIEKISGYRMGYEVIQSLFNKLKKMSIEEIHNIRCIPSGREDVILAGNLILLEFMEHFQINEVIVSERGLRYGIAIRECEKHAQ
jgi:exopolyphosphatase / guanosine-5'-triphosphate,3'-diphosphate pyrophosphatase